MLTLLTDNVNKLIIHFSLLNTFLVFISCQVIFISCQIIPCEFAVIIQMTAYKTCDLACSW